MKPVRHKLISIILTDLMPFLHGKPGQAAALKALQKAYRLGQRSMMKSKP